MTSITILQKEPVCFADVKDEIAKMKKRDSSLGIRAERTEEYLGSCEPLKKADAEKLKKKIIGLKVPRISEEHIVKIIDILPEKEEQVKVLFSGSPITIGKEHMKKIADAVKKR